MTKSFALETLNIRINEPEFASLNLHLRIQRGLRQLILDGLLIPGSRLPATRTLSKSLGVARDTVEMAYSQLYRDGYIIRREGSGSFVADSLGFELQGAKRHKAKIKTQPVTPCDSSCLDLSARGQLVYASRGVTDQQESRAFATGLPETRSFPVGIWERLQRQIIRDYRANILLHGSPEGVMSLRQAIADYLNLERGAAVSADQVLILSSTRQALFLCAQILADAGQSIYMEDPGYFGAQKVFESAGLKIIPISVDNNGLQVDLLSAAKSGANCVYITPSHQYPTGVTLSLERRLALIHWANENNGWIIEDDYDSEFHYEGLPTACIQGLDKFKRTLYLGTFSKTLFPGLRIGYMVLPETLVAPMRYARSMWDGHTPQILQLTLARFMEDGYYNSHVRAMRKIYAARRAVILNAIENHLQGIVEASLPPGGLQISCFLVAGWSEAETIKYAANIGIVLPSLSRLYKTADKRFGWLLGFAALTDQEIETTIARLGDCLNQNRAYCYTGTIDQTQ